MPVIRSLILILLCLSFISCDEGGVTLPVNCLKKWTVNIQGTATAAITSGSLVISAPNINTSEVSSVLNKGTLTGDFVLTAEFESFNSGNNLGAYFMLAASTPTSGSVKNIRLLIGNVTTANVGALQLGLVLDSAGIDTSGAGGRYRNITATSGRFVITRTGTFITLQAVAGAETISLSGGYTSAPLTFSFLFGSNFQPITNNPSVKITQCNITGATSSGNSDVFDCNSLE